MNNVLTDVQKNIIDTFEFLSEHGYRIMLINPKPEIYSDANYFFLITPHDNILNVSHANYGGWDVYFQYVPSKTNGTGCQCFDTTKFYNTGFNPNEMDLAFFKKAEQNGLLLSHKYRAVRYANPEQWMNHYWDKANMFEYINNNKKENKNENILFN